ncbi:hypothetical protein HYV81_00655 [Candidatus Woesearchaeota archaeon]|nr:hypothetical protein [Candidatus Woesearchaeota archaeon]
MSQNLNVARRLDEYTNAFFSDIKGDYAASTLHTFKQICDIYSGKWGKSYEKRAELANKKISLLKPSQLDGRLLVYLHGIQTIVGQHEPIKAGKVKHADKVRHSVENLATSLFSEYSTRKANLYEKAISDQTAPDNEVLAADGRSVQVREQGGRLYLSDVSEGDGERVPAHVAPVNLGMVSLDDRILQDEGKTIYRISGGSGPDLSGHRHQGYSTYGPVGKFFRDKVRPHFRWPPWKRSWTPPIGPPTTTVHSRTTDTGGSEPPEVPPSGPGRTGGSEGAGGGSVNWRRVALVGAVGLLALGGAWLYGKREGAKTLGYVRAQQYQELANYKQAAQTATAKWLSTQGALAIKENDYGLLLRQNKSQERELGDSKQEIGKLRRENATLLSRIAELSKGRAVAAAQPVRKADARGGAASYSARAPGAKTTSYKGWEQLVKEHTEYLQGKRARDTNASWWRRFSLILKSTTDTITAITSYTGQGAQDLLARIKIGGVWYDGLKPGSTIQRKDAVQQAGLYVKDGNKIRYVASVNYEKKPAKKAPAPVAKDKKAAAPPAAPVPPVPIPPTPVVPVPPPAPIPPTPAVPSPAPPQRDKPDEPSRALPDKPATQRIPEYTPERPKDPAMPNLSGVVDLRDTVFVRTIKKGNNPVLELSSASVWPSREVDQAP